MRRSRPLFGLLIALTLFCCATRLFTEEVFLNDDPTTALRLRAEPFHPNIYSVDSLQQPGRIVLMQDENELIVSGLYRWITGWGWIAMIALTVGYAAVSRPRNS